MLHEYIFIKLWNNGLAVIFCECRNLGQNKCQNILSIHVLFISSKSSLISSRQELRRFLRQVKRQNPEKTCFLEYDKLYVDHKPYVWNEVRWKTILNCFSVYNIDIKKLQVLMKIVYLKFRYWGKLCLLQRISDSVEWPTGVC